MELTQNLQSISFLSLFESGIFLFNKTQIELYIWKFWATDKGDSLSWCKIWSNHVYVDNNLICFRQNGRGNLTTNSFSYSIFLGLDDAILFSSKFSNTLLFQPSQIWDYNFSHWKLLPVKLVTYLLMNSDSLSNADLVGSWKTTPMLRYINQKS